MNQLSQPDTVSGDIVLSAMRDSLFASITQANPNLAQAVLFCSIPRWFDKEVVAGMCVEGIVRPADIDVVFEKLVSLTFCIPHPIRARTWAFQRPFRDYYLTRRELIDRWQELHLRAAETFKRILGGKRLDDDRRFQDEDWRLVATEWLHHLLHVDQATGLAELNRVCAEALAIPVDKGPSWEIDFCVRLLTDLEWPSEDVALSSIIEDLRHGFGYLAAGRNIKALPMVKRLAEVPGLTPQQRGELHLLMGITHLYDEGKKGPALEEFDKAKRFAPNRAKVHAEIAAVHAFPGTTWGRFDQADESARQAIRVEPTQAEGHVALGRICAQQEDWPQAITDFEKAIEVEPDDVEGYLALSDAYAACREVEKAIQLIDKAWQISDGSEYIAAIRKANVFVNAREFDRARTAYQRAYSLAPDQPATSIALGGLFESIAAPIDAAEMYRKAIDLDPTLEDGYVALARLYAKQDRPLKAIEVCQTSLERATAGKAVYLTLSSLYEQQERLSEVEAVQEELATLDWLERYGCDCAMGAAWLARTRKRPGSPERTAWLAQARAKIDHAMGLDSQRAWAYILLAELLVLRGEADSLHDVEQTVTAQAPWARYDWLVYVAQTCLQSCDGQRCEALLKRAVDLAPHRTAAWQVVAELRAWQGDPAGVAQAWESLVQLDPIKQYDADIALGNVYFRVQDYARARQAYSKALVAEPNTAQGYLSLSRVEEAEGHLDEAERLYQVVADKAPGWAALALTDVARVRRDQGRFQAAEETLRHAIRLDLEQGEAYLELARLGVIRDRQDLVAEANEKVTSVLPHWRYDLATALGHVLRSAGRYDDARHAFEQGCELDPDRVDAYLGLAEVFFDQAQWADARAMVDRAISVDRAASGAYAILSRVCDAQSDADGVILAQRRIVEIEPTEIYNACINSGGVYEKTGQLEQAEQSYREALALCPWQRDAYIALGLVLTQLGKLTEMEPLIEKAKAEGNLGEWPLGVHLWVAAGQLSERRKDPDRAKREYERAIALDPQRAEGYQALVQLLESEKRLDEAIQVCQQMAKQPTLADSALLALGNLLAVKQDDEGAEAVFHQALKLAPQKPEAYLELGQLLVSQERHADATIVYRQMAKQPELAWQARVLLGDLWAAQAKPKQAEKAYRQAIKADPQQPIGYLRLAQLYQKQGDLDRAEALIEDARTAAPDSPDPYVVLAQLREQQGRTDDAIALYRQVAQRRSDDASTAYERIGDLLIAKERYDEAAAALQLAVQKDPANAGAYFSLGTIYEQQANSEQAIAMYSRAIDAHSRYLEAYFALGRIYGQQGKQPALESVIQQLMNLDLGPEERYRACWASAELYKKVDDIGSAVASYERAIALDPQRAEGYQALVQLLESEKRLDEAIQVCQQMAKQPTLADSALLALGNLLAVKQDDEGAEAVFHQALKLAPQKPEAYLELGQLLVSQERHADATIVYRQMAKQPELAWQARVLLGDLWAAQAKPKQAEKAYRQAIKADPQQPIGYLRLAQLYQKQGDLDRAEALIEDARTAAPDSPDPYVVLAQLREQQGRTDDAIALYRQVAQRRSDDASTAYERIGDLLIAKERYDEAAAALQLAVQKDPANAGAYFSLGTIYEQQANSEQAIAMYSRAIDTHSRYFSAYEALLRVFAKQKEVARIANLSERFLALELNTVDRYNAHMMIGAAYQNAQAPEWATDAFKAANDLDPARTEAYLALSQVYEMQRRWADARTMVGKLDELVPAWRPDVHYKLGELYAMEGLLFEAEHEYRKVISLEPDRPLGYHGLAQTYMLQERWSQAAETWKNLTRLKEVDPASTCSAYLYLACIHRTLGAKDDMSADCSKVVSFVDEFEAPGSDLLRQKGLALYLMGQYDRAQAPLRLGLQADPQDSRAHFYLALNSLCQGQRAEAEQSLRQGIACAKEVAEFDSAILEAKALATRTPEIPGAKEMLEALQKAAANGASGP